LPSLSKDRTIKPWDQTPSGAPLFRRLINLNGLRAHQDISNPGCRPILGEISVALFSYQSSFFLHELHLRTPDGQKKYKVCPI
ncbi:hypothetical protein, partial [Tateyamaria sp.]|uniref:hypothetical protein n=1 Tax=Tateyamaria sp. TaxID=1929288 RepID=UPI0032DD00FA